MHLLEIKKRNSSQQFFGSLPQHQMEKIKISISILFSTSNFIYCYYNNNLNESQLYVGDSHFLQLVSSYENLLKVYESCFSLKFDRLCNKGVDWIFLLFPADTLRKADVTWNKLIFFIKLVSDTIASFPYHSATLPELLQDSNAI